MDKKKVTAGLIILGVISSNISSVKAIISEDNLIDVLDEKENFNNELNNKNNKNKEESNASNNGDTLLKNNENLDDFIEIKDENLLKAINLHLNKDDLTSKISLDDVFNIIDLNLSNCEITDLSGLEYFKNLQSLDISNNNIIDISSLSNLPNLKEIKASNNNICDISYLKTLNLINADFSNQSITLEDMVITNNSLNIKNPVKTIEGLEVDYIISNNGIYLDNIFIWDDLLLKNYNLEILFDGNNENIKFSGLILQNISKDDSIIEDIKVEITPNNNKWTNLDLIVNYNISGGLISLIDKVVLPNEEITSDLNGSFKVSDNGIYNLKIYFKNGEFIEENIEIKNIDKSKPIFNVLNKTTKDSITTIELEAIDTLSGIEYILLPNGKKIYNNKITYSSELKDTIYFKAVDFAGNYEEFEIFSENTKDKSPNIHASDKKVILGTEFNPFKGVSATDYNGNDITDSIIVVSNPVDIYSLGEYIVTYKVKDSNGYESTKSILVEVVDKAYPENNTTSSDNKDILQLIEADKSENNKSKNNLGNISKSTYFTAIIFSMISGFRFLFKSGRDDF